MDALTQIANAVLYEGYILWPYRRTTLKNQQRWTFGGVYPRVFADQSGGSDRAAVRTECILEADIGTSVGVRVRFLQVVTRQAMAIIHDHRTAVNELTVGNERYLSWDEATEREYSGEITLDEDPVTHVIPVTIDAGYAEELLGDPSAPAGVLVRSWSDIRAEIAITAERRNPGVYRLGVTVRNTIASTAEHRSEALRHTLVSLHVVLHTYALDALHAGFVSLTDPPAMWSTDAASCTNDGLWPVLVGDDGSRDTVLASPIILPDYPRIAPESPGDMFDGGEIDQMLILNVLTMTAEEQDEMRDTDPRAREILDRCTTMSRDDLMRLHGAIRSLRPLADIPTPSPVSGAS